MKHVRTAQFWIWVATLFACEVAVIVACALLVVLTLPTEERAGVRAMVDAAGPALAYAGLLLLAGCGAVVHWLFERYPVALRKLAEQMRVLLAAGPQHKVGATGAAEVGEVAALVNRVAERWSETTAQSASLSALEGERLRTERDQFAALLAELAEGVVVCNASGQVLLFNARAGELLGAHGAGAPLGLGRSIFSLLDRDQVAHALDKMRRRFDADAGRPQARFVTASLGGAPVRVRVAPYAAREREFAGMVFTLNDANEAASDHTAAADLLQALGGALDEPLSRLRAAVDALVRAPAVSAEHGPPIDALAAVARDIKQQVDAALAALAGTIARAITLEDVRAVDLLAIAEARLKELGFAVSADPADSDLGLRVDSFLVVQLIATLATRVRDDYGMRHFRLRSGREQKSAVIDLLWRGTTMGSEALAVWQDEPLHAAGTTTPLTLRQVIERHGGAVAYQADRPRHDAWIRLQLPAAESALLPASPAASMPESRPEFYDFELLANREVDRELSQRPLASLAYTAFDTETTGLEPSAGDEIISIGAVRIVNGRLLRRDVFEQLVDPRRRIDRASTRVHGINAEAVAGQPTIDIVLPRFHRFCEGTVLVAHNAAFDMRFLALKEQHAGVRFDHFVLDTLLLSAVVFPNQDSHELEALAQRFSVPVIGRHTALGDALVTGEVFLHLLPLLAQRGIASLSQALEVSRTTRLARLQY